eukprot:766423-Rhodomonas_salina.1
MQAAHSVVFSRHKQRQSLEETESYRVGCRKALLDFLVAEQLAQESHSQGKFLPVRQVAVSARN